MTQADFLDLATFFAGAFRLAGVGAGFPSVRCLLARHPSGWRHYREPFSSLPWSADPKSIACWKLSRQTGGVRWHHFSV